MPVNSTDRPHVLLIVPVLTTPDNETVITPLGCHVPTTSSVDEVTIAPDHGDIIVGSSTINKRVSPCCTTLLLNIKNNHPINKVDGDSINNVLTVLSNQRPITKSASRSQVVEIRVIRF